MATEVRVRTCRSSTLGDPSTRPSLCLATFHEEDFLREGVSISRNPNQEELVFEAPSRDRGAAGQSQKAVHYNYRGGKMSCVSQIYRLQRSGCTQWLPSSTRAVRKVVGDISTASRCLVCLRSYGGKDCEGVWVAVYVVYNN